MIKFDEADYRKNLNAQIDAIADGKKIADEITASAGDQIHRKLIVPASGNDFVRRLANGPGNGPIQSSHFQIGERGGLLDHRYRPDQHHAVLPETVPVTPEAPTPRSV